MGRIRNALGALFADSQWTDEYTEDTEDYQEPAQPGRVVEDISHLSRALGRKRASQVGLPNNLNSESLKAIAVCMDNVVERKYSFREEECVVNWIRETDHILAQAIDAGASAIRIDFAQMDPRLDRFYQNYLGSDPLQMIRLEAYAIILWVETNRGICPIEDWICTKIDEILNFLTTFHSYSHAQAPLGVPDGKWNPDYNPTNVQGLAVNDHNIVMRPPAPGGVSLVQNSPKSPVQQHSPQLPMNPYNSSNSTEMA